MSKNFELFYQASQRIQSCLSNENNKEMLGYLDEMNGVFAYYKKKADESEKFLESEKQQKKELDKRIKTLKTIDSDLSNKIREREAKLRDLQEECETLEKQNIAVNSNFRSKSIKLGKSEKRYEALYDFVQELYLYINKNRCATKSSLEQNLRKKLSEHIDFCDDCENPIDYCECE